MSEQSKKAVKDTAPKKSIYKIAKDTLGYFYPAAWKKFKGFFLCGAANIVFKSIQPFVSIMVTPLIIDELLGERNVERLIIYAAIIAVGGSLLSLLESVTGVILEKYDEKMQNYFTEEMSRRVMELDFQLTEDKKALDQIESARQGLGWYSGGVYGISIEIFQMISNIIKITGVVSLIVLHAPLLFVFVAILLVINGVTNSKLAKTDIQTYERLSKFNRLFGYFGYDLTDFRYGKDIRLYDAHNMMVEKWQGFTSDALDVWKWRADKRTPLHTINGITDVVRKAAAYLYLGILVITGRISIGVFSQMLSAGNILHYSLIYGLIFDITEFIERIQYAHEYVLFMNYPPAIEKGTRHVDAGAHTLEFKHVSFAYPGSDVKVLEDISVTLKSGEHLSIVGLNGAGKTTFVKLLCRLYDTTSGEILLDGVNIKEYDYNEYMSLFAPVFQDFKLFAFSIRDNITLDSGKFGADDGSDSGNNIRTNCINDSNNDGNDDSDNGENDLNLNSLIEQVGLGEKVQSLENGIDTILFKAFDENGIEPSGGEQQKIAIARALFKNSPVVILDEPTAALDPIAEYDIYRQFDTLVGGKTAIYISHRLSSCKFCDRIAVFSEGRIMEYGTHDELVCIDGGLYAKMFAAQAQYYN
ncbi:MAG: ABC transporter ATP-binding protein/permease [Butyrivibrio sp.]|nr:ABC transporter ATP-binding protein/permease [Butyrivibrio sp.]